MIYFDHNATTALDPRVLDAMMPSLQGAGGNASSLHRPGRAARDALEAAREQVAQSVGVRAAQVIFTSGGTEANNLALRGVVDGFEGGAILYGATEHSAVLEPAQQIGARKQWRAEPIPADTAGLLDAQWLAKRLSHGDVRLVSIMRANNETGVVQDVAPLFELARAAGAVTHCDAVQALGKIELEAEALNADFVTLSAHKIGGPKGAGALITLGHVPVKPQMTGGGQERGWRGGTENVPACVGFGAAAELMCEELTERTAQWLSLQTHFEQGLAAIPSVEIFAAQAQRLPNTTQFRFEGFDGEGLLMSLDNAGIAVSSGSACDSGSGEPSHVLLGMGIDPATAKGAVRVSFGAGNTIEQVDQLLAALSQMSPASNRLMRSVAIQ